MRERTASLRADDERVMAEGTATAGTFSWIPELGCASVAAVRGHAYGAGLQLALACDYWLMGAFRAA